MVHPTASVKSNNINSCQVLWLGSNPFIRINNYEMQRKHNHAFKPFHLDWKTYFSISSNDEKKAAPKNRRIHEQIPCGPKRSTGWRVQPTWKTWLSNRIISANRGENKTYSKPPPRQHQLYNSKHHQTSILWGPSFGKNPRQSTALSPCEVVLCHLLWKSLLFFEWGMKKQQDLESSKQWIGSCFGVSMLTLMEVKVPAFQVPTPHRPRTPVALLPPKHAPAARPAAWRGSATLRVLQALKVKDAGRCLWSVIT